MTSKEKQYPENFEKRVREVFSTRYEILVKKTDRLFAYLFAFQWLMGIAFAFLISPRTWSGDTSQTHIHVQAAIIIGGLLAALPTFLIWKHPGATVNRMVVAVSQILFSVLFIHLTGGRIETHFHIFGSLAFLAFYRDWRVVLIGTVVTAADHLIRGEFWPQSAYGVLAATPWRAIEHAAWVVFEDFILFYSIKLALGELRLACESHVKLEENVATVEEQVIERTRELRESQRLVLEQQQAMMASSKMSALGEMAGGVAHEINNPLASIKSFSSQLQEVVDDDPLDKSMLKEMSAKIEKTTDRIAKIVAGLRSFSRDGSNDKFETVNIHQLVEETLSFCQERFKNHGTTVTVDGLGIDLSLEGRTTELSQVLLNLLNNAYDAISASKEKWIKISAVEDNGWVEILVMDSGKGIPKEAEEKIFQPFFTTKEIGKGTGMGLSISSGIVRKHQGELKLNKNCPNTCFVIRIPKKQATLTSAA